MNYIRLEVVTSFLREIRLLHYLSLVISYCFFFFQRSKTHAVAPLDLPMQRAGQFLLHQLELRRQHRIPRCTENSRSAHSVSVRFAGRSIHTAVQKYQRRFYVELFFLVNFLLKHKTYDMCIVF